MTCLDSRRSDHSFVSTKIQKTSAAETRQNDELASHHRTACGRVGD